MTDTLDLPRSKRLKAMTHEVHDRLDKSIMEASSFDSLEGYGRFALGLAPLSGIGGQRMAPTWAKVAALVFRHGERFYGFRGLRAYKEKFQPEWAPRYIAGPGGLGLVKALRDLNALIADGGEGA